MIPYNYLDFQKAFDRVPHEELLYKLHALGISGALWRWFKEYLTSRWQMVSINGHHSPLLPVSSGVPQGSILGPMLFLVYINDLPLSINFSNIHIFADDTKCSHQMISTSDTIELQSDIDRLNQWSSKWSLSFNKNKCVLMQFSNNPSILKNSCYFLSGRPIPPRESHRDLGIILQRNLGWHKHYDSISAKAYRQLGFSGVLFHLPTQFIPRRNYTCPWFAHSYCIHCSQLWRPMLVKDTVALEYSEESNEVYFRH